MKQILHENCEWGSIVLDYCSFYVVALLALMLCGNVLTPLQRLELVYIAAPVRLDERTVCNLNNVYYGLDAIVFRDSIPRNESYYNNVPGLRPNRVNLIKTLSHFFHYFSHTVRRHSVRLSFTLLHATTNYRGGVQVWQNTLTNSVNDLSNSDSFVNTHKIRYTRNH